LERRVLRFRLSKIFPPFCSCFLFAKGKQSIEKRLNVFFAIERSENSVRKKKRKEKEREGEFLN
jgi:hypothetical protein